MFVEFIPNDLLYVRWLASMSPSPHLVKEYLQKFEIVDFLKKQNIFELNILCGPFDIPLSPPALLKYDQNQIELSICLSNLLLQIMMCWSFDRSYGIIVHGKSLLGHCSRSNLIRDPIQSEIRSDGRSESRSESQSESLSKSRSKI